jgi:hypothetical protein
MTALLRAKARHYVLMLAVALADLLEELATSVRDAVLTAYWSAHDAEWQAGIALGQAATAKADAEIADELAAFTTLQDMANKQAQRWITAQRGRDARIEKLIG